MLKSFYRFWFRPDPGVDNVTATYAYADTLQAASEAVSKRIGQGTLTGRVDSFELQDANQFMRRGGLESNLCPDDLLTLCRDLQTVDMSGFNKSTLRLIQDLYGQEYVIQRHRDPAFVGKKQVPRKLLEAVR